MYCWLSSMEDSSRSTLNFNGGNMIYHIVAGVLIVNLFFVAFRVWVGYIR